MENRSLFYPILLAVAAICGSANLDLLKTEDRRQVERPAHELTPPAFPAAAANQLSQAGVLQSDLAAGGRLVQEGSEVRRYRWGYDLPGKSPNQRSHYTVLRTFRDTAGAHWMSTVRLMHGGEQLAMGLIVDANGWIVSKSSELPDGALTCRTFDAKQTPARVVLRRGDLDLALVKVDADDLPAAKLDRNEAVVVGSFVSTSDSKAVPMAMGAISVLPRMIGSSQAVLGVRLDESDKGVVTTRVLESGGAARAGILNGDVILAVNGTRSKSLRKIQELIAANRSGDRIEITISREGKEQDLDAQLTDMNIVLSDPTEAEVNGEISARASDFISAFQHDTVLTPNQCGGPLVNLQGKIVGLNIARGSRVHCYALPMDVLVPAIDDMLHSASLTLRSSKAGGEVLVDSRYSKQLPSSRFTK